MHWEKLSEEVTLKLVSEELEKSRERASQVEGSANTKALKLKSAWLVGEPRSSCGHRGLSEWVGSDRRG